MSVIDERVAFWGWSDTSAESVESWGWAPGEEEEPGTDRVTQARYLTLGRLSMRARIVSAPVAPPVTPGVATVGDYRFYMLSEGWFLEYQGQWYKVATFSPNKYANTVSVSAYGAETDLDRFLTNYGQVPFSMRSHTPTEIMEAVFGGQPECEWYNGTFSLLSEEGFPLGWTETDADTWSLVYPEGENLVETTAVDAELSSEGLNHTSGAQIKPIVDVYVDGSFVGQLQLVVSWRNALGTVSHEETILIDPVLSAWTTFTAPDWLAIRNERCVLKLVVISNIEESTVRFRRIRFLQDEEAPDWQYFGAMDTRPAEVYYNDGAFLRYGTWTLDHMEQSCSSSAAGDTLLRSFTGHIVTVNFGIGGTGASADILVDGLARVENLDVSVLRSYQVSDLDRYRPHTLEIVVKAGTVVINGLTLSGENRISVTWNGIGIYQALRALKDIVGGEYTFDTRNRLVYHDPMRGDSLTELGLLWLREGQNLASFVPTYDQTQIQNRCYFKGYGDGAFQIGAVVDSDLLDEDGRTSIERYGVQRFSYTNKDCRDHASAVAEALQQANARAFRRQSYTATVPDSVAALCYPGDSVRVTHSVLAEQGDTVGTRTLRVLEVQRTSDSQEASLLLGDRIVHTDPASQFATLRRKVEQLLRAY